MKDDYTTNSSFLGHTFFLQKVGRMYFLSLWVKRLNFYPTYCIAIAWIHAPVVTCIFLLPLQYEWFLYTICRAAELMGSYILPAPPPSSKFISRNKIPSYVPRCVLITRAWKATSLKMRIFFFLSSTSASTDWLRNNTCDVASRRKLAPKRRGRLVRALDSRPECPEFKSHSQQFEIQGHAL